MNVQFERDYRGVLTKEKYFPEGAVATLPDAMCNKLVENFRATVTRKKATHRDDGWAYAEIKASEKARKERLTRFMTGPEIVNESEEAMLAGIDVKELRSRKKIAETEPEAEEVKPKPTRKRRKRK